MLQTITAQVHELAWHPMSPLDWLALIVIVAVMSWLLWFVRGRRG